MLHGYDGATTSAFAGCGSIKSRHKYDDNEDVDDYDVFFSKV